MTHDIIVLGGGLAGSSFAARMARHGCRVLVLERETRFKDRVRGENMLPWGVDAARRLGILDALRAAGGHQPRWWTTYAGGEVSEHRDLAATTAHGQTTLNVYHPDMQETLLQNAVQAGAEVKRGVRATGLALPAGATPARVSFENGGGHEAAARLVVGADGRFSQIRSWAGFRVARDPELLSIAGLLLEDVAVPEDSVHLAFGKGIASLVAPLGGGRARTYFVYPSVAGRRELSGSEKTAEFLRLCIQAGIDPSWLAKGRAAGPLAEFEGADHWVEAPVRSGVALIGDAAAATDPSWGCGLSLTLLDVEHLGDALCSGDDWSAALSRYAREHDEYASTLRRVLSWMNQLFWSWGPEADARRARVFARMLKDPRGFPDSIGHGPFGPSDERARRLILGEEEASPAGAESV